jgi:hypothetical protein
MNMAKDLGFFSIAWIMLILAFRCPRHSPIRRKEHSRAGGNAPSAAILVGAPGGLVTSSVMPPLDTAGVPAGPCPSAPACSFVCGRAPLPSGVLFLSAARSLLSDACSSAAP